MSKKLLCFLSVALALISNAGPLLRPYVASDFANRLRPDGSGESRHSPKGATPEATTDKTKDGPAATSPSGMTPLHRKAANGNAKRLQKLLSVNPVLAFFSIICLTIDLPNVDVVDKSNKTPLHHAAKNGKGECITILLDHGATIDAQDIFGWTPLHFAAEHGHLDCVQLLVTEGADITKKTRYANTAQDLAEQWHQTEITLFLQELGS